MTVSLRNCSGGKSGTLQMAPKHSDPSTESNRIISGFVEKSASTHLTQGTPRCDEEKLSSALETVTSR